MNYKALYIKTRKQSVFAKAASVVFFLMAMLALLGIILSVIGQFAIFDILVDQSHYTEKYPDSMIKTYRAQLTKSIISVVLLGSLSVLIYLAAGFSLIFENKGGVAFSYLGYAALMLINLVVNMVGGAYTNVFGLFCDIIIIACIWLIFSMLLDSTKIYRFYTPPKKRYFVFATYVLVSLISFLASPTFESADIDGAVKLGMFFSILITSTAIYLTMRYMLVEDIPLEELEEQEEQEEKPNFSERLAAIKPINNSSKNTKEQLDKYRLMYINGTISKKEYEIKKKELDK